MDNHGDVKTVCIAPCGEVLPMTGLYWVAGKDINASDKFQLPPGKADTKLHVSGGSKGAVTAGVVLASTATLSGQTSEFGGNVTVTGGPNLVHTKTVAVESDPLNNTSNPKSIPGAIQLYTVRVTNQGAGTVDNDSLQIVDAIPANTSLCGLAGAPVTFTNGTPVSGLTFSFTTLNDAADGVDFSNTTSGIPTWTYVPAPTNGCDANVHYIRIKPRGTMAGAGGSGNPYFEVRFRVRVQ